MYSHIDNITLQASWAVSKYPLGGVWIWEIDGVSHFVTADEQREIQVFNPEKNEIVESFTPEGVPTLLRVFQQFSNILFLGLSKQGPGGSVEGYLMILSGADKLEVHAHDHHITDMICIDVNNPSYTGQIFFTCSLDCKY